MVGPLAQNTQNESSNPDRYQRADIADCLSRRAWNQWQHQRVLLDGQGIYREMPQGKDHVGREQGKGRIR